MRITSSCNGTATVDSNAVLVTVVTTVTRRQGAANGVLSQTSVTTNWTRPTQAGSLLVAVVSLTDPTTAYTTPAGWQLAVTYAWNNVKTSIYYYPNNPGGRTSETITMNVLRFPDLTLQLLEYVAAVAASPLDRTAFDGDAAPRAGLVSTGTTITTSQPKEVLVSALAINTATGISAPDNSFVEVHDTNPAYAALTAAVHERIVSGAGAYGHNATAGTGTGGSTQWVGAIATFKSLDPATACTAAPSITTNPTSRTINPGQSTTLTVTASGQGILTYQWYQGAAPSTTTPVGTNSSSLTVTPSATTSYWVKVSNGCGSVNSTTATVTVCDLVSITAQPTSRTINAGSPTTLSVTAAAGSTTLSYQWYQGTAPSTTTPVGTNSNSLTVTPSATTNYWVRVSNFCNSADSTTATVAVCNPPSIAAQPQSQSITSGATATLTVTAGGSGPFSYQWYEGASGTTTSRWERTAIRSRLRR